MTPVCEGTGTCCKREAKLLCYKERHEASCCTAGPWPQASTRCMLHFQAFEMRPPLSQYPQTAAERCTTLCCSATAAVLQQ